MIWNPSQLPTAWTLEHLLGKHSSEPFNPNIANVFFRAGMIESWGLGIEKMRQACLSRGLKAPRLREQAQGLWVEFGFPVSKKAPVETPVKARVETLVTTPAELLAFLQASPGASLAEVAVAIGKSVSAVERASARLTREGKLRFVGPRKSGRWEVLK